MSTSRHSLRQSTPLVNDRSLTASTLSLNSKPDENTAAAKLSLKVSASTSSRRDGSYEKLLSLGKQNRTRAVFVDDKRACLACGRLRCSLITHRHYTLTAIRQNKAGKALNRLENRQGRRNFDIIGAHVGDGQCNPFVKYPVEMTPEMHMLFDGWHRGFRQDGTLEFHIFPIKVIDTVLPLAMKSPVLFQSLIAVGATTRAAQSGVARTQAAVLKHHGKSLRLLLDACSEPDSHDPSAIIIAATWIQRNHLLLADTSDSLRAHQDGIRRLVAEQGGLHNLSPMAAYMVENLDASYALFTDAQPTYINPVPKIALSGHTLISGRGFDCLAKHPSLDPHLHPLFNDTRLLWDILTEQTRNPGAVTAKKTHYFAYLFARMQKELIGLNALYHDTHTPDESLVLANLIFINHLRGFSNLYERLARRLLANMDYEEQAAFFLPGEPGLLMWMLCMTYLAVRTREDKARAVSWLRRARATLRIESWERFREEALDPFVWLEEYHLVRLRRLWLVVDEETAG